ncbi:MAG: sugar phosphate nucleotidyltransferase [Pseudobdellovibrionaceae bacterium]|uniref:sugar phosphate nucleotidyltransferase n=1 Tax=Oligoflexus sp. TaxID=1971216 RepID=UPI0027CD60C8|nr:sugar phosphate nucleotidyltransferase [Oligoflexus sp.]MDQ3234962.1 sugar phosphate nucleotidyltransferase [Pseudobdellovibrionaceae bacterium]HYX35364.1 sugar phosphate nucleotidyltransferase [Oligoflexus sp.]
MQAVILAGGKGSRLKPFTVSLPKPLVPIDDVPILEVVLKQLKRAGFTDIVLAVNHLSNLIMAFFGDGKSLGLNITYSREEYPLGTAAPLRLVDQLDDNFLVMNGDLLTTIDYAKLMDFHRSEGCDITIATYKKEVNIDLGVLKCDGKLFLDYIEKPTYSFDVSMGIYIFKKEILEYIPRDGKFDMPELVLAVRDAGKKISCFSGEYYWLDIGRVADYETANQLFKDRRSEFLPE